MNENNKVLTEKFFSSLEILIESNYNMDRFENIVLKVSKKELVEACNNMIKDFANKIEEDKEEVKEYLLKMLDESLTGNSEKNLLFEKEHKLIRELLTFNNNLKKTSEKSKQDSIEK